MTPPSIFQMTPLTQLVAGESRKVLVLAVDQPRAQRRSAQSMQLPRQVTVPGRAGLAHHFVPGGDEPGRRHEVQLGGDLIVAVGNTLLTIIWHLLSNPDAHYHDLGADCYESKINKRRRERDLIRQLEHLTGHTVTLHAAS